MAVATTEQKINTARTDLAAVITTIGNLIDTDAEKIAIGGEGWRDVQKALTLCQDATRFLEYAVVKNRYPGYELYETTYAGLPALDSIVATPATDTIDASDGETQQLTVIANYADGYAPNVTAAATYVSSDPTKATVSSAGLVTAVAAGETTVTVSFEGEEDTCVFTVNA